MWVTVALKANHGVTRLKRFVLRFSTKLCNSLFFCVHLMFHAYVQRFDGMDEKILNRALLQKPKTFQNFQLHRILRHIYETLNIDGNKN